MPILDLFYRNFLIGAVYRGRARAKRARARPKNRTIVVFFLTHSSVFYNYVKLKKKSDRDVTPHHKIKGVIQIKIV